MSYSEKLPTKAGAYWWIRDGEPDAQKHCIQILESGIAIWGASHCQIEHMRGLWSGPLLAPEEVVKSDEHYRHLLDRAHADHAITRELYYNRSAAATGANKGIARLQRKLAKKEEKNRLLKEQIRVADSAFNSLNERFVAAEKSLENSIPREVFAREVEAAWKEGHQGGYDAGCGAAWPPAYESSRAHRVATGLEGV